MKVLYFDHTSEMGGAEHNLLNLLTHLEVEAQVATTAGGPLIDYLEKLQIPVNLLDISEKTRFTSREQLQASFVRSLLSRVPELWSVCQQLRRLIGRTQADLLQTNTLKAHVLGSLAVAGTGVPIVWHLQDLVTQRGNSCRLLEAVARLARPRIVCISQAVANDLSPYLRRFATVIHNGINVEALEHAQPGTDLRSSLNIPATVPLVGLVGHLIPWKGHRHLLAAAAQLHRHYPDVHYLFVGGEILQFQGQRQILEAQAASLGIAHRVVFTGIRSDIAAVMHAIDLLALPSEHEPFGRVLVEAMACARPIVATAGGGVPEIVQDGETGILVPVGDSAALARGIRRFLAEPHFARRAGLAGQERARQFFTLTRMARQFHSLYGEIA